MARGPRAQVWLFHLLLFAVVALLAWLSQRQPIYWDWTLSGRNTLAPASLALLERLEAPLELTSFAPDNPGLRRRILNLLERYRRARPDRVTVRFVDPELHPERARAAGIELAGELVLEYGERRERLRTLSEAEISHAILRLLGRPGVWIGALTGHGERGLDARTNADLGRYYAALEARGYAVQPLDLTALTSVPENLALLVIASPRRDPAPAEARKILDYLDRGGTLLWLTEPDAPGGLEPLAETLGAGALLGQVVDADAASRGIDDPSVALVARYPDHPATRDLDRMAVFPGATGLEAGDHPHWRAETLLATGERSWNETGPLEGEVRPDPDRGERTGPLALGLALTRDLPDGRRQRAAVLGDGDFLSNAFLDSGANQALGLGLVRWLLEEDRPLDLPPLQLPDRELTITRPMALALGVGTLVVGPLVFLGVGLWIRQRRRKE